jgi:hypothetical protein
MLLNLRLKFHADGSYDKCKARAVIMGNGMCYPRDHGLTHAPTARGRPRYAQNCAGHCTNPTTAKSSISAKRSPMDDPIDTYT